MKTYCPVRPRNRFEISFDVIGREGNPVDHRIECVIAQRRPRRSQIADVAVQNLRAFGHGALRRLPAIEQIQLVPAFERQLRTRRTDDAGTADKEDFHDEGFSIKQSIHATVVGLSNPAKGCPIIALLIVTSVTCTGRRTQQLENVIHSQLRRRNHTTIIPARMRQTAQNAG